MFPRPTGHSRRSSSRTTTPGPESNGRAAPAPEQRTLSLGAGFWTRPLPGYAMTAPTWTGGPRGAGGPLADRGRGRLRRRAGGRTPAHPLLTALPAWAG